MLRVKVLSSKQAARLVKERKVRRKCGKRWTSSSASERSVQGGKPEQGKIRGRGANSRYGEVKADGRTKGESRESEVCLNFSRSFEST